MKTKILIIILILCLSKTSAISQPNICIDIRQFDQVYLNNMVHFFTALIKCHGQEETLSNFSQINRMPIIMFVNYQGEIKDYIIYGKVAQKFEKFFTPSYEYMKENNYRFPLPDFTYYGLIGNSKNPEFSMLKKLTLYTYCPYAQNSMDYSKRNDFYKELTDLATDITPFNKYKLSKFKSLKSEDITKEIVNQCVVYDAMQQIFGRYFLRSIYSLPHKLDSELNHFTLSVPDYKEPQEFKISDNELIGVRGNYGINENLMHQALQNYWEEYNYNFIIPQNKESTSLNVTFPGELIELANKLLEEYSYADFCEICDGICGFIGENQQEIFKNLNLTAE